MAQGKKELPENSVEKIGFLVNPDAEPEKCFEYLLVQFKKKGSKLRILPVPASDPYLHQYYCCLFVLCVLAYRRSRWQFNKGSHWPKKEPVGFPLTANVNPKESMSERFRYGFMVNYYFNLMKADRRRYSRFRSDPELLKLRDNILSIFESKMLTGKKFGAEGGKAVNLAVGIESIKEIIYFWKAETFSDYDLNDPNVRPIDIPPEGIPASSIQGEVLEQLLDGICNSGFWRDWQKRARKKSQAIIPKGDVEEVIRKHLKKDMLKSLSEKLRDINDYINVGLEADYAQEKHEPAELEKPTDSPSPPKHKLYRNWKPLDRHLLLESSEVYILCSNLGTGKTTFLRHLQKKILEDTTRIPIFINASEIEQWEFTDRDSFINCLSKTLQPWLPKNKAVRFLKKQLNHNVLLLVDELDQITQTKKTHEHFLRDLFSVVKKGLIIASRPSAVAGFEEEKIATFLRLKPFDTAMQMKYFSEGFSCARRICKNDHQLLSIPISAFMLRDLIENKHTREVNGRADLYRQFIDRIFFSYKYKSKELSEQLRDELNQLLKIIAYDSMVDGTIGHHRISFKFCRERISSLRLKVQIDDLPKCGFVTFARDASGDSRKYLCFTSQSYREYLAAEWITESEERINRLAENYWNPKWHEVIKFVAGLMGEDFVRKIYLGPYRDNVLQARLLMAAECAGETRLDPDFEFFLICQLKNLSRGYLFETDVFNALFQMRTKRSKSLVWPITEGPVLLPYSEKIDPAVFFEEMFSKQQLLSVLKTLTVGKYYCSFSAMALRHWSWAVPSGTIDIFIDMLESDDFQTISNGRLGLRSLSSNLTMQQIRRIFNVIRQHPKSRYLAIHSLEDVLEKLTEEELMYLVTFLDSDNDSCFHAQVCASLDKAADQLSAKHIEAILQKFWTGSIRTQENIAFYAHRLKRKLSTEDLLRFVTALEEPGTDLARVCLQMLEGCLDRLPGDDLEKVLQCIDRKPLAASTIRLLSSYQNLHRKHICRILDMIRSQDVEVQREVLNSVKAFREYVEPAHIRSIIDCANNNKLYVSALEACIYIQQKIESEQLWKVIEAFSSSCLVKEEGGLDRMQRCFSTLSSSSCLSPERKRDVIQKASRREGLAAWEYFLYLVDVNYLDSKTITSWVKEIDSVKHVQKPNVWSLIPRILYEKLWEAHKLGKLV